LAVRNIWVRSSMKKRSSRNARRCRTATWSPKTLQSRAAQLAATETQYREASAKRRDFRKRRQDAEERLVEVQDGCERPRTAFWRRERYCYPTFSTTAALRLLPRNAGDDVRAKASELGPKSPWISTTSASDPGQVEPSYRRLTFQVVPTTTSSELRRLRRGQLSPPGGRLND
jgi:hypothetical protein